jgi:hypothetical protein
MNDHRKQAREGLTHPLSQAIRACGWAAFTVTVLGTFGTLAELHAAEKATIAALGTMTPGGYNRAAGGMGTQDCRHADTTRDKQSQRALASYAAGRRSWNTGKKVGPLSDAHRAKLSAIRMGRPGPNKGGTLTDEHRAKLRAASLREKHPHAQPVEVDGRVFPAITVAMKELGLSKMQIRYRLMLGKARRLPKE